MEFLFRMYGVSRCMCYVRVTYVWRMKRTRDVSTTYVLVYVPFLSAAYLFCTNCFDVTRDVRTNLCNTTFTYSLIYFALSDACSCQVI